MKQGRVIWLALVLGGLAVAGVLSCATERGLEPIPKGSRIYVTLEANPPNVLIFDGDADSLVDSLKVPINANFSSVVCDPSAPRFVVSSNTFALVYQAGNHDPALRLRTQTVDFAVAPMGLLIGSRGSYGGVVDPVVELLDISSGAPLHSDTIALSELEVNAKSNLVFGISYYEYPPGNFPYRASLCAYDYKSRSFHKCWTVRSRTTNEEYYVSGFAIHPDSKRAYLTAKIPGHLALVGLDLDSDSVLFETPLFNWGSEPEVTPDGREVWFPIAGTGAPGEHDAVQIYDAQTGVLKTSIDLSHYRFTTYDALNPYEVKFTPNGTRAYLLCEQWGGPVLLIDTHSLEVIREWWTDRIPPRTLRPLFMDIGPAP